MWTETPRRRKTSKSADVQKRRVYFDLYRRSSAMVDVKMFARFVAGRLRGRERRE